MRVLPSARDELALRAPPDPDGGEGLHALPRAPGWAYEPKWDGFRALAWSGSPGAELSGAEPRLDSRNRRPLLRYFPELVPALEALPEATVVDGEIVVVIADVTDFEAL